MGKDTHSSEAPEGHCSLMELFDYICCCFGHLIWKRCCENVVAGRGQGEGCEISRVYGKCCGWNLFSDCGSLGEPYLCFCGRCWSIWQYIRF
jgi:hypothetical protein